MGAYKYIQENLEKQYKVRDEFYRQKMMAWRNGPVMEKVEYPSNLPRARRLGFKAKQGYIVVRTKIEKGRRTRRKMMGGRKHKNYYRFVQPGSSHQAIAEQRVNRLYKNMEVLNSYWVGEDGVYKYFEVILADPTKPTVNISSVMRTGKSFRGLTASGNSGTPNKKKAMNKKRRMKAATFVPYHYEEYVKKEKAVPSPKKETTEKPTTKPTAKVSKPITKEIPKPASVKPSTPHKK